MRSAILTHTLYRRACCFLILALSAIAAKASTPDLSTLNLPAGFKIEIYASVDNARQMAAGATGITYVGSMRTGKVYAVIDSDGDHRADAVKVIAEGLTMPSGVAYRNGDLYIAAISTIYRLRNIDARIDDPGKPEVILDTLPDKQHHGWKFIAFGPDGLLYVPVGAPCNVCLSDDSRFASILRLNVDSPADTPEIHVAGIRNTVGFDWDPVSGDLWFTDNGRDMLGDDIPPCELNHVTASGQHFGFPFFHGNSIRDPDMGGGKDASDYVTPALALGPHVAPLGMMFYTGTMLPESFRNQIILAEHGSWNRSVAAGHTGYRLIHARRDAAGNLHEDVLVDGWLQDNKGWGRPVDVLQQDDGSLLVSDDTANVIYRISYQSAP